MTNTSRLDAVNRLSDAQAAEQLRACNASPRWIEQVLAHRPYADLDTVLDTAEHVARDARLGPRSAGRSTPTRGSASGATGASTEAQWSRREQSTVGTSDDRTQDVLRAGNAAYERRFGHVFLIRAAVAAPRRWWPSWTAGSATTRRASAPR